MSRFADVVAQFAIDSVTVETYQTVYNVYLHFEDKLVVEHPARGEVAHRHWELHMAVEDGTPVTEIHVSSEVNTRTTSQPLFTIADGRTPSEQIANALTRLVCSTRRLLVEREVDPYA